MATTEGDLTLKSMRRISAYRKDPALMVRTMFHVEPDAWQLRALAAFASGSSMRLRLALQACVGPGKTAVLAWIGINFMACYCGPGGRHPSGLCISESGDNLRDNLWKEIALWYNQSDWLRKEFDMTTERFFNRQHPKTWFLAARTWSKTANQEAQGRTLSGLHSDFILYLIDESGDIPPAVLRSAEQGLSSCRWGRIVQAGNPTSHDGMLYHAATVAPQDWTIIRITSDPDDPERTPRVDSAWARQQIDNYGRNNPWVMAAILGQFPPTAINALLGPDEMAAAMGRQLPKEQYVHMQKRIGVDVARFGDDATVLFPRQGRAGFTPVEMRNADGPTVAARLMAGKLKFQSEMELIDDTGGYASSVIDACQLAGVSLMRINFSGKADDPRYFNKRSEMCFRAAEWIKNGGCLPHLPQLQREACAHRYYFEKGKFRVIEKDAVKKQLNGHSPDLWDAFILTFGVVEMPASDGAMAAVHGNTKGKASSDWDPYAEKG